MSISWIARAMLGNARGLIQPLIPSVLQPSRREQKLQKTIEPRALPSVGIREREGKKITFFLSFFCFETVRI